MLFKHSLVCRDTHRSVPFIYFSDKSPCYSWHSDFFFTKMLKKQDTVNCLLKSRRMTEAKIIYSLSSWQETPLRCSVQEHPSCPARPGILVQGRPKPALGSSLTLTPQRKRRQAAQPAGYSFFSSFPCCLHMKAAWFYGSGFPLWLLARIT